MSGWNHAAAALPSVPIQ